MSSAKFMIKKLWWCPVLVDKWLKLHTKTLDQSMELIVKQVKSEQYQKAQP